MLSRYQREVEATNTLITIDEEQQLIHQSYQPYKQALITPFINKQNRKRYRTKIKTQVTSPSKKKLPKLSISNRKEQIIFSQKSRVLESSEFVSLPLKNISLNQKENPTLDSKGQDKGVSKKKSETHLRPVVYVSENREIQEQQKIRSLIKRKILAKNLFKKSQNLQNRLIKHRSQVRNFKKNVLVFTRAQQNRYLI